MDTTTANKLEYILSGYNVSMEDRDSLIDLMDEYASQFQQEWIPVEVRLPENDELCNDTVLFTCGNVVRLGCYDYEDGFWHERYGGKYIDTGSHMKDQIKGGHITHWKPITIPQPYNPK